MADLGVQPITKLAQFAAGLSIDAIPLHVRERVKDILLDALASALAGHQANETEQILSTARDLMGNGRSSLIGGGWLSLAGATMVNGYLITAVTVCDVHRPTLCHVSPEVIPPALAVAERLNASGSQLLAAITAGLELTTRVGIGINYPAFRARGWHSPGVIGPFGGAASAGLLLGLDAEQMTHAMGIAGSQSSGSFAQLGTPTMKFSQARGALSGLLAAQLAARGFTSTKDILLHPDGGLYFTHSDGGDPDATGAGLGDVWELENISLRPWPVGAYLQTAVSALLEIAAEKDILFKQVQQVQVAVAPEAYRLHAETGWEDSFEARLSLRYVTAVVLRDRRCWLEQFTTERVNDKDLDAFARNSVKIVEDSSLPDIGVSIEMRMLDGTSYSRTRAIPRGDAGDPLTRNEIIEKFRVAGSALLRTEQTAAVIDFVEKLEDQRRLDPLMEGLRRFQEPLMAGRHRARSLP
jgi:2-methylcitrate dehydratase PrpD